MRKLRTAAALLALGLLGWVLVSYRPQGLPMGRQPSRGLVGFFLVPLAVLAWGVLRGRRWALWSGASVGLAVFPWALVLSVTPSFGAPITRQVVALVGSTLLLLASFTGGAGRLATGPTEIEGPVPPRDSRWISWSLILNLASALNLAFFVVAYDFGATWQLILLGCVLGGLLLGVVLLAGQRTVGLLLLAGSALTFIPAAALFLGAEARSPGEAGLFVVLFAPGVIAAVGTLFALGRPLLRMFGEAD